MPEARGAFPVGAEVVDDRVLAVRIDARRHAVELQDLANPPGDVVIGAGGIAADAEPAHDVVVVIEGEATAEYDRSADALADHRIRARAELRGVARACFRGGRARGDETVERLPGLSPGEEVRGRDRHALHAEGVRRAGLLHGDRAAARPLVVRLVAAVGDGADRAVAGDHARPFVIVEAAVPWTAARLDARPERLRELVLGHRAIRRLGLTGEERRSDQRRDGSCRFHERAFTHASTLGLAEAERTKRGSGSIGASGL